MKKVLVILLVLFMIAGSAGTVYFYIQYKEAASEKEVLIQQNAVLQNSIDAIGPITQVWTVKVDVFAGKVINEDELIQQTIPISSVTDNYIMDKSDLVGKYYKVNMHPGVSLTKDVIMEETMDAIVYERDMTFDYLPLGLAVGDYVDIRVMLPYGEEFIVIEHERVMQVVENARTIKLLLNEAQLALWTSAMTDDALWGGKGLQLYITKYVEPGITDIAVPYYPVRKEMESVVTLNPNIKNKKECINATLRDKIEQMLANVTDQDFGILSSGRGQEASGINGASTTYVPENPPAIEATNNTQEGDNATTNTGNGSDEVINFDKTDLDGNASTVTEQEKNNAQGEDQFHGEDVIK